MASAPRSRGLRATGAGAYRRPRCVPANQSGARKVLSRESSVISRGPPVFRRAESSGGVNLVEDDTQRKGVWFEYDELHSDRTATCALHYNDIALGLLANYFVVGIAPPHDQS